MKRFASLATAVAIWGSVAVVASAHHSAAQFDFANQVAVQGVLKSLRVMNPHTRAVVAVTDAKKGMRDVDYEGHSASIFLRAGYTPGSLKYGDKITIIIAPRRDGEDGGFIMGFTTPSGQTVGFAAVSPTAGKEAPATSAK